MKTFQAFFFFDCQRLTTKRRIFLFLFFLVVSLFILQKNINRFKENYFQKETFSQDTRVNNIIQGTPSSFITSSFQVLTLPAPTSIFVPGTNLIPGITTCCVTADHKIKMFRLSAGNLFIKNHHNSIDFFGFLLFVGSLFSLWLGFDFLHYSGKEYYRFITSMVGHRKLFFSALASRFLLAFLLLLITLGSALLLVILSGITLTIREYAYLSILGLVLLFISLIFTTLGIIFAATAPASKPRAVVIMLSSWFILLFIIPSLTSQFQPKTLDIFTPVINLETQAGQAKGDSPFPQNGRQEPQDIAFQEMSDNIHLFQYLSNLLPTSFYHSLSSEISSCSYTNYLEFFQHCTQFVKQHSKAPIANAQSTIYKTTFNTSSKLPSLFIIGLLLTIGYSLVLTILSYSRFRAYLYGSPGSGFQFEKTAHEPDGLALEIDKAETIALLTAADTLIDRLYNVFAGIESDLKEKIIFDEDIVAPAEKVQPQDFLYLCHPAHLPAQVECRNFLHFIARLLQVSPAELTETAKELQIEEMNKRKIQELPDTEKIKLLWAAARFKKSALYILNNIGQGLPSEFITSLQRELLKLKKVGSSIIYISNDVVLANKIGDRAAYLVNDTTLPSSLARQVASSLQ